MVAGRLVRQAEDLDRRDEPLAFLAPSVDLEERLAEFVVRDPDDDGARDGPIGNGGGPSSRFGARASEARNAGSCSCAYQARSFSSNGVMKTMGRPSRRTNTSSSSACRSTSSHEALSVQVTVFTAVPPASDPAPSQGVIKTSAPTSARVPRG
jgi:hypothetical protein